MQSSRNIYKEDVDFAALALQDVEFAKILKSNGQVDFSDPKVVEQLTKSLLRRDFGLEIKLPGDRLCPPVPNRLNYLLWIQDLLDSTSDTYSDIHDPSREVIGLDIGTGASCIYPLLGSAQHENWKFLGTDVDEKSFDYAVKNVQLNKLDDRIRLHRSTPDGPIFPLEAKSIERIDFTMCNPPFYSSASELAASAALKQRPPMSSCTGAPVEMVCAGGEVAFVSQMLLESLHLKDRVQWFSSMLGKLSSVSVIVEKLKTLEISNWAVMEFVQGSKTRRWAVAWSFEDLKPTCKTARGIPSLPKHLMPFPSEYVFKLDKDLASTTKTLNITLEQLDLRWKWKQTLSTGVGFASKNVWSRAARRKASRPNVDETKQVDSGEEHEDEGMAFGFKIRLTPAEEATEVTVRWLKGFDHVIFESFCGMLKRKFEL